MTPVALLALACVVAVASVPASTAIKPKISGTKPHSHLMTWNPIIQCVNATTGTAIKVLKGDNLGKYSLEIVDPPAGCTPDIGKLSSDVTIPANCLWDKEAEVMVKVTGPKDVCGGNYDRQFYFSCNGTNGEVYDFVDETQSGPVGGDSKKTQGRGKP